MALEKEIEFENGFTASYHKIYPVYADVMEEQVRFVICSYKNKAIRDLSLSNRIHTASILVPFSALNLWALSKDAFLSACYVYLKTLDTYEDAQDV